MKLDNYISELLYQHDCVIVSDFGGFVAKHKSATVHPVQHTFTPSSKQIAFNQSLTNNDGLLANYIANKLFVSYPDACRIINDFVIACNQKLADNNKLTIENIGDLFYDYENNLQFTPDEKINYLLDSFGLAEIQSPAIRRENEFELFESKSKIASKILPAAKKRRILRPLVRTLSVAAVAALAAFAFLNPTVNSSIKKSLAGITLFENIQTQPQLEISHQDIVAKTEQNFVEDKIVPVTENKTTETITPTSEEKNTAPIVETKEETEPVVAEPTPEIKPAPIVKINTPEKKTIENTPVKINALPATNGNFFIVGGCFGVHENAVAFVEELRVKGYPSQIIGKGKKGLEMVCISSAPNRNKAEEMLGFIQDSGYPDAWILKK